mmetsp:Transcript_51260/g.102799  ORF Transcript_51260/g.102799 Transcript_51260/m.102799 type:complete len:136 (+) Transcript_51260:89-496(+)
MSAVVAAVILHKKYPPKPKRVPSVKEQLPRTNSKRDANKSKPQNEGEISDYILQTVADAKQFQLEKQGSFQNTDHKKQSNWKKVSTWFRTSRNKQEFMEETSAKEVLDGDEDLEHSALQGFVDAESRTLSRASSF